jgi:hypothetical protein
MMSNLDLSEEWVLDDIFNSETTVETPPQLPSSEDTEEVIESQQQHQWNQSESQLIQDLGRSM